MKLCSLLKNSRDEVSCDDLNVVIKFLSAHNIYNDITVALVLITFTYNIDKEWRAKHRKSSSNLEVEQNIDIYCPRGELTEKVILQNIRYIYLYRKGKSVTF